MCIDMLPRVLGNECNVNELFALMDVVETVDWARVPAENRGGKSPTGANAQSNSRL